MQDVQVLERRKTAEASVELFLTWDEATRQYVSYIPSLELSSYHETEEGAILAIKELLPDTIDEMTERKTLVSYLLRLGWALRQFPEASAEPPRLTRDQLNMAKLSVEYIDVEFPL